jgi:hypothetical protein
MFTRAIVILNDALDPNSINIDATVNLTQAAFFLSAIVNGFGNQTVGPDVSQVLVAIATIYQSETHAYTHCFMTLFHACTLTHIKQLVLSIASGLLEIAQNRVENGINVRFKTPVLV